MSLPVYQHINLKSAAIEELAAILNPDMNLRNPVVINVKDLDLDQQREAVGLIENYFTSQNLSFKFPYPLYVISHHEKSITNVPLLNAVQDLPKFYQQKESKMNIKEAHLAGKNKLLQQEVQNMDASSNAQSLATYGENHRMIYELETERKFYRSILNRLLKAKKNG